MSTHTPTPWIIKPSGSIYTANGRDIVAIPCSGGPGETRAPAAANAAFIVRAVNCHADLLAACKAAEAALMAAEATDLPVADELATIRAAIAKAEK